MNHSQAVATLTSNPLACVFYQTRDATRSVFVQVPVRLENEVLVQANPSNPRGPAITAPEDVVYYRDVAAERATYDEHGARLR